MVQAPEAGGRARDQDDNGPWERGGARGGARRANRRVVSRRGRGYSNSDLPAGAIGRNEWARPR